MTSRRAAWLLCLLFLIVVVFAIGVKAADGENYGGVSPRESVRIQHMIHAWFDSKGVGGVMTCIANRESGFNRKAFNNDRAPYESVAGLFQIKWPLHARRGESWRHFYRRMSDPVQNIRLAFRLYRHGGLGPWGGGC